MRPGPGATYLDQAQGEIYVVSLSKDVVFTLESEWLHLTYGGPLCPRFRRFLLLVVGVLFLFGIMVIIEPRWLDLPWPWDPNVFDASIIASWSMGGTVWAGITAMRPTGMRCVSQARPAFSLQPA